MTAAFAVVVHRRDVFMLLELGKSGWLKGVVFLL